MINWRRLINRVAQVIVEETKEPEISEEIKELAKNLFNRKNVTSEADSAIRESSILDNIQGETK